MGKKVLLFSRCSKSLSYDRRTITYDIKFGLNYFIHEATGYIFSPHCYEDANPEPIGQLKEDDLAVDDFKKDKYPLLKKEIIWFYHYELDAEMVD